MAQVMTSNYEGMRSSVTSRANVNNLENRIWFSPLSENEKEYLEPEDYPIISVINAIPQDKREEVYNSLTDRLNVSKYIKNQVRWIRQFYENMDNGLEGELSEDEEFKRIKEESARYRLYMAIKHPEMVVPKDELDEEHKKLVDQFFSSVEKARQKYFREGLY